MAERVVPPRAFYSLFLGLSDADIQWIEKIIDDEMGEDEFGTDELELEEGENLEKGDSASSKIAKKQVVGSADREQN
jgi:hypothetical protein